MNGTSKFQARLLFSSLLSGVLLLACDPVPGPLVPVRSIYFDEALKKDVPLHGVGTLIEDGSRTFVLTAAHVSQGARGLELGIAGPDGKAARVLGRLADNRADLELIEIDKPGVDSLVMFDPFCQCYVARLSALHPWTEKSSSKDSPRLRSGENVMAVGPTDRGHFALMDEERFLLIPPWRAKPDSKQESNGNSVSYDPNLKSKWAFYPTASGIESYATSKIEPGLSGTPVFRMAFDWKGGVYYYRLVALAKSYLNYYKGSFFVTEQAIMDLRTAFLAGKRGNLNSTSWRMRKRLTFRDFGQGTLESCPRSKNAGGNGTTSDGGNGTTSDGGDDVTSDQLPAPQAIFEQLDICPGVVWRGSDALGLRLNTPDGRPVALAGNTASLTLLDHLGVNDRVTPVKNGDSLLPFLQEKFSPHDPDGVLEAEWLSIWPYGIQGAQLQIRGNLIHLWIPFSTSEDETLISLVLDERGIPTHVRSDEFRPVIDLRDPDTKMIYRIDLTGLFFEDPSIQRLGENGVAIPAPSAPTLRVLVEGLGKEFHLRFDRSKQALTRDFSLKQVQGPDLPR